MKQLVLLISLILIPFVMKAQGSWTWTQLADLPIPTSNNALVEASTPNGKFAYSFGGITDSLTHQDIHQRVFKYNVSQDIWSEMDPIPDTLGKIGSAASFVNGKIYLIGGYHVEANGDETSSEKVHIYNPLNDEFEPNGTNLPIPIDDHVQAVWKDSLIYVVTGWSNTSNSPAVQIYNPYTNTWTLGESTPNTSEFKSFGASGYILGDTIFYFGGVKDAPNFETTNFLRKGVIDPNNPTQIDWSIININSGLPIYRSACSGHNYSVFWIGGTQEAYNYNAIEYYTNDTVYSNSRIFEINFQTQQQSNLFNEQNRVMDLRGIAKIGGGNWIIAGGIDSLKASNETYLLHNPDLSNIDQAITPPYFEVYSEDSNFKVITENVGEVTVYDIQGRTLFSSKKQLADLIIEKSTLQGGMLLFTFDDKINLPILIKKINQ
ncbi:Kelch repeat-containing protein [Brumimicrobium aurantiacum]|uniref:T9SS C-terminal target domain-containing protein n=1 Tax=Brumimicrobium aurantiacum TaxID=1737063 RepID=A0A3E1F0Y1_9FLAO|nr:hypothetical protein [Brumimicrobium aurantiacum]RFC55387.1 hypothetical protein DXU93_00170 [Brumimicrobium aurantiacum]